MIQGNTALQILQVMYLSLHAGYPEVIVANSYPQIPSDFVKGKFFRHLESRLK